MCPVAGTKESCAILHIYKGYRGPSKNSSQGYIPDPDPQLPVLEHKPHLRSYTRDLVLEHKTVLWFPSFSMRSDPPGLAPCSPAVKSLSREGAAFSVPSTQPPGHLQAALRDVSWGLLDQQPPFRAALDTTGSAAWGQGRRSSHPDCS